MRPDHPRQYIVPFADMLLRHSIAYLFARGVPGVINFASLVLFTRIVEPEEYGIYALAFSVVTLLNAILFEWLRLGVLRFLPGNAAPREVLLSTALLAYSGLIVGVSAIVVVLLGTGVVSQYPISVILLGYLLLVSFAWHEINLELARSELAPLRYGWLSFSKQCIFLIVGGGLAYIGFGGQGLLAGLTAGCLIPSIVATAQHWRGCSFSLASGSVGRKLIGYGLPLTINFALAFILSMSDRILIGWIIGADAAGLYAVGYDLSRQSTGMLMMIITLAAYPLAVRALEQSGESAARAQLRHNVILLMIIGAPATAGMMVLSDEIANLVIGESFRETAAGIIPWIALGALLQGIKVYYLDHSFQLAGRTTGQVWVALVAACSNVALNIVLLPQYGVMAAAHTTVVAYLVAVVMSFYLGRRVFPLPVPIRELALIGVATSLMTVFLIAVRGYSGTYVLGMKILGGIVVYGSALFAMNVHNCRSTIIQGLQVSASYVGGGKGGGHDLKSDNASGR